MKISQFDLDTVVKILDALRMSEINMADFYGTCAAIDRESERQFWLALKEQEINHSKNLEKMIEIVSKKPEIFSFGRAFNVTAINTVIQGIKNNLSRLEKGEIDIARAVFLALDIENSVIEARYNEILQTENIEYQTLVKDIVEQTIVHRNLIKKKTEQLKSAK